MKLRYYAEADVGVDHRRTLELLESIHEAHAIPVEVVQVDPQRAPPAEFVGETETRSLAEAWDDFTHNRALQDGLGGAPSDRYRDREDVVGNVGIVVDGDLVWATEYWGTHHGWGPVDPERTAIGFLEEVDARGTPAVAERVPLEDWSPGSSGSGSRDDTGTDTAAVDEGHRPTRDSIRNICTAQSFQRGVSYVEEGRVRSPRLEGSEVTATVRGSREYRTTVDLSVEGFDSWCSCPYDHAGDCKHVVAVLLAVRERYDDLVDRSRTADVTTDDDTDPTPPGPSEASGDLERALETADAETLREFLRSVLSDDDSLRERFLATVDEPVEKSVADYKRDVDRQFENATGRRGIVEYDTHLRFGEYYDLADTYRESGEHERALEIHRALAEAIRENLDRVDDSSGHYGRHIERAVDAYAACLREATFGDEAVHEHVEYLYEQYRSADFVFVQEYYDGALREVCTTTDDLEHLLSLLRSDFPAREGGNTSASPNPDPEAERTAGDSDREDDDQGETVSIPDPTDWRFEVTHFTGGAVDVDRLAVGPLEVTDFIGETLETILADVDGGDRNGAADDETRAEPERDGRHTDSNAGLPGEEQRLLSTYLWVLSELEDRAELQAVLEDVYTERSEFYRQYVDLLVADGQDDRAREVIEDGLEEFPHSAEVHRLAADFYRERDDDRYRELLQTLFVRFEDRDAYDELKAACSSDEWESVSHGIRTQLGRLDPDRLIDRYVHEDELDRALETVLESDDLETLRRYRDPVADVDPASYFEAYRDLLGPYLAGDTGRDHYRSVIEHLRVMETLGFDDELAAFVDRLADRHSNRPAFLDELEDADDMR